MSNSKTLTQKERHEWERSLLEEMSRIGKMVEGITPEGGHLSLTWFPGGHVNVLLFGGGTPDPSRYEDAFVLDAWAEPENGALEVHRT